MELTLRDDAPAAVRHGEQRHQLRLVPACGLDSEAWLRDCLAIGIDAFGAAQSALRVLLRQRLHHQRQDTCRSPSTGMTSDGEHEGALQEEGEGVLE